MRGSSKDDWENAGILLGGCGRWNEVKRGDNLLDMFFVVCDGEMLGERVDLFDIPNSCCSIFRTVALQLKRFSEQVHWCTAE